MATAVQQPGSVNFESMVGVSGTVAIRVVVLPRKEKKGATENSADDVPLDVGSEEFLPDSGATPLASYLETSKGGKRCCVFLINGQRQDSLDNNFIIQQLGFKYLRNRMMIVVDVDGLAPEALGRLMQGSRQAFFKGALWEAILARIVATLKNDPDLRRLEDEAEEQVSQLEVGDEKVKQALDQLIDSHHEHGLHFSEGGGAQGDGKSEENLGIRTIRKGGVVSLLLPRPGTLAEYPAILSPASSPIRLRPNADRKVSIKVIPPNCWEALAEFTVEGDPSIPELSVTHERLPTYAELLLRYREPIGFEEDQYPLRAVLRVTARFNGLNEPRQLKLNVVIKRDNPPPESILTDTPSYLKVTSRQPVLIRRGESDTHVCLRWDGKDHLAIGREPQWRFYARLLESDKLETIFNYSEPRGGRFTLLIAPRSEWRAGDKLNFESYAVGPHNRRLTTKFSAQVIDPPEQHPPDQKEPRLIDDEVPTGASRRPPYKLIYIGEDKYEEVDCWGETSWTDEDPGCFLDPTETSPLTLIINKDMAGLREHQQYLTKSYTEVEVKRRITKYTSHIAFHLYQMYQASNKKTENGDVRSSDEQRRAEIQRVAMTLIRLMEVSR